MNRWNYEIKEHIAEGLIKVFSFSFDFQLWALSDQIVRKNHECIICEKIIFKGKDRAYRPITNLGNRMERMCQKCAKKEIKK